MNNPVWIDEKGKIVEPEYCRGFSVPASHALHQRTAFILWMARCRMRAN